MDSPSVAFCTTCQKHQPASLFREKDPASRSGSLSETCSLHQTGKRKLSATSHVDDSTDSHAGNSNSAAGVTPTSDPVVCNVQNVHPYSDTAPVCHYTETDNSPTDPTI